MKWNKREFVEQYIAATIAQDQHGSNQRDLIDALAGTASDFEGQVREMYTFVYDVVDALIGKDNAEWINWYLYDNVITGEGRKGGRVEIDGVSHVIDTVDQLFDICMDKTTFAAVFDDGGEDYRITKAKTGFQMIADSIEEDDIEMAYLVATRINLDPKGASNDVVHV